MFAGEESCTSQQRGNEAAPQWVPEAGQRSVEKKRFYSIVATPSFDLPN